MKLLSASAGGLEANKRLKTSVQSLRIFRAPMTWINFFDIAAARETVKLLGHSGSGNLWENCAFGKS